MEAKNVILLYILTFFFQFGPSSSTVSSIRGIHLTSSNVREFASYIHSSANTNGRVIHFGKGTAHNEKLLEVPLGEVHPRATIVVTVGLDKSHPNTKGVDSDLSVGISDGKTQNMLWIVDVSNYKIHNLSPCYMTAGTHDGKKVSSGTKVPSTFKLLFTPFYKYMACETVQDGGYINTGTFNAQINPTKPLSLRVSRNQIGEQYYIYYLNVEIF